MAWGCFVVLLLLAAAPLQLGQRLHLKPGFEYSYDCGVRGMQLLVFPRPNQTVQFKVLGECWQTTFPVSHAQSQAQPAARREIDLFPGAGAGRVESLRGLQEPASCPSPHRGRILLCPVYNNHL